MKILFLSSEVAPFFRETEQGDACEYLTKALKYQGHDVRVIAPRNKGYGMGKYSLREIARLKSLTININDVEYQCSVKSGFLPGSRAQVYFIEYPDLYNRKEIYQDPSTGRPWDDSLLRFSFLNHASLQLLLHLQWLPDVIQCLDWRMALVPYIINYHNAYKDHFVSSRTILQLHNFHQLDVFTLNHKSKDLLKQGNIPEKFIQANSHQTAWLTTGIDCADQLISLGKNSLNDILPIPPGNGDSARVTLNRSIDIHSIPLGIDCKNWDPSSDKHIAHRYNIDNFFDVKSDNKSVLCGAVNLADNNELPIVAIIGLTSDQPALDIVKNLLKGLHKFNSQFIIIGEHDYDWQGLLAEIDFPGKSIVSVNDPTEKLKHQIVAGSDILLIPSAEKCGCFNQMHGLRYGTIPIVFKDQNITNKIVDAEDDAGNGNGFLYKGYTANSISKSIQRALKIFESKDLWYNIQSNAMSLDLNWKHSVEILIDVYQQAKENPKFDST